MTFNDSGFQTAGTHTLVATYSGDPLVTAGSSRSTTAAIGTPVTLTAAVKSTSSASATIPTGYVTFNIDGVVLPTVALDATGQASLSYTYATSGSSSVTVTYSGDNLYYSAVGNSFVSVQGPPPPTIALALSNCRPNHSFVRHSHCWAKYQLSKRVQWAGELCRGDSIWQWGGLQRLLCCLARRGQSLTWQPCKRYILHGAG